MAGVFAQEKGLHAQMHSLGIGQLVQIIAPYVRELFRVILRVKKSRLRQTFSEGERSSRCVDDQWFAANIDIESVSPAPGI